MATVRNLLIVIVLATVMAIQGHHAAPSEVEARAASGETEAAVLPDPVLPSYSFDWHDVRDTVDPVIYSLAQTPWGTCAGHIANHIAFAADESGVRSLASAPVDGEPCTYQIIAREGLLVQPEDLPSPASSEPCDACLVHARWLDADGVLHDEPPWASETPYEPYGPRDVEEKRAAWEERMRASFAVWNELQLDPTTLMTR